MFVRYIFDVKKALKVNTNNITIVFQSPVEKAEQLFSKQAEEYEVPPLCVPDEYRGECHVNHIRKMQASFAWDWGPAFPSVGIWYLHSIFYINEIASSIFQEEHTPGSF